MEIISIFFLLGAAILAKPLIIKPKERPQQRKPKSLEPSVARIKVRQQPKVEPSSPLPNPPILKFEDRFEAVLREPPARGPTLRKKKPLTKSEQKFFKLLKAAVPDLHVFPQVAFSAFLYAKGGSKRENFSRFSQVRQKVVDFVICDDEFNIVCVVELDDWTHDRKYRKDKLRDENLLEAGIQTVRFDVRNDQILEAVSQKIYERLLQG